jgi:gamma-glutamylcyclotransferase
MTGADTFLNFAYGSNLLVERLRARTPSARPVTVATLSGHALRWHKRGMDGSAKCDAAPTGADEDVVWGVVFRIARAEKPRLDSAEGLGRGYREDAVIVTAGATTLRALSYLATDVDPALQPFHWYKAYVLAGARQHGLPEAYVERILAVPSIPDPDPRRAAQHEQG